MDKIPVHYLTDQTPRKEQVACGSLIWGKATSGIECVTCPACFLALLKDAHQSVNEARRWAGRMLREATIAQQNHVSAIQREMISGSKLFDRETRLTTLAKELGRVQRERDAEVERAVEAETEVERLLYAMDTIKYYLKTGDTELLQKIARERGDELWTKHNSKS